MDAPRGGRDDVLGAGVEDRVDRIQSQAVKAEVPYPALGALDNELAHRVAVGVVVVDCLAPGRLVLTGKIGPDLSHRGPAGGPGVVEAETQRPRGPSAMGPRHQFGQ